MDGNSHPKQIIIFSWPKRSFYLIELADVSHGRMTVQQENVRGFRTPYLQAWELGAPTRRDGEKAGRNPQHPPLCVCPAFSYFSQTVTPCEGRCSPDDPTVPLLSPLPTQRADHVEKPCENKDS